LGSAVAEVISEECPAPLCFVGIKNRFGEVGKLAYLLDKLEIDAGSITLKALMVIEKRNSAK